MDSASESSAGSLAAAAAEAATASAGGGSRSRELPVLGVLRSCRSLVHLMVSMAMFAMGLVVAFLSMVDVAVQALCPGQDQCPEALLLSSVKAVTGGTASIFVAPWLGSLSDSYGRKPFLLLCLSLLTFPFAILMLGRARWAVYLFYIGETIAAAAGSSAWITFIYAYVADLIPEESQRLSAFGLVTGVMMFGFVFGPLTARLIPEAYSFQMATLLCTVATLYMAVFLPESMPQHKLLRSLRSRRASSLASEAEPLLAGSLQEETTAAASTAAAAAAAVAAVDSGASGLGGCRGDGDTDCEAAKGTAKSVQLPQAPRPASGRGVGAPRMVRSKSSLREAAKLFSSSRTLAVIVVVSFLHSLADNGQTTNMFYVFKAQFHWSKDDFSVFTAGIGICALISQIFILPLIAPHIPVKMLLTGALLVSSIHTMVYGIAWAPWMVYSALSLSTITTLIGPSIGSVVAKIANPSEQGKLQGVVSGVGSLAGVLAPLTITPLTAYFVSDKAPFHCPGFGILVAGFADLAAFFFILLLPSSRSTLPITAVSTDSSSEPTEATTDSAATSTVASATSSGGGGSRSSQSSLDSGAGIGVSDRTPLLHVADAS